MDTQNDDGDGRVGLGRWATWTAGFLAFPIAGPAGIAAVGRVDDPVAGLVGGAVTGAVVGAGQWLAARGLLGRTPQDGLAWVAATAAGMGVGLAAGAAAVGYDTTIGDLALQGAITGVPLGLAQAALLRATMGAPAWAPAAMPVLWALGWVVTTAFGIDVERQFTTFGATGAITFMALSGLLLARLAGARRTRVRS